MPPSTDRHMDVEGARKGHRGGTGWTPAAGQRQARTFRIAALVIVCTALVALAFASGMYRPTVALVAGAYQSISLQQQQQQQPHQRRADGADGDGNAGQSGARATDKYLGGLLAASFDEHSCLSRYQAHLYRKPSPHKPSRYLVKQLRRYEENHRRCAPYTGAYNRTLQVLDAGTAPEKEQECKYVIWTPCGGMGNRILSIASTFVYALLTDRVLLIDPGKDMETLLCEPFPGTSWLVPSDFPIKDFKAFDRYHPRSYGNLLKGKKIDPVGVDGGPPPPPPPPLVYIHLKSDFNPEEMFFYCEPDQEVLRRVPWLLLRSDIYFTPAFFLNEDLEPELSHLFPAKDTVFHHIGRYLFHPTNNVWGMTTSYYKAYMAMAKERLGLQIRIFSSRESPFDVVSRQVVNCTLERKLLPEVEANLSSTSTLPAAPGKTKAVLITSLESGYYEMFRKMYLEHPAAEGVAVSVHQPTQEGLQQTGKASHDAKAWAEMNLLSFADVLVTSAWSTFGYIAQGLGGIRPWTLYRVENRVMPEPSCVREVSMEPCMHKPPAYICRDRKSGDSSNIVPFVTRCADVSSGIKLVNRNCFEPHWSG